MLWLIAALSFLTVFILVYIALKTYAPMEGAADFRLRALDSLMENRTDLDEELSKPFAQRVLSPLTGSVAARLTRFSQDSYRSAASFNGRPTASRSMAVTAMYAMSSVSGSPYPT